MVFISAEYIIYSVCFALIGYGLDPFQWPPLSRLLKYGLDKNRPNNPTLNSWSTDKRFCVGIAVIEPNFEYF